MIGHNADLTLLARVVDIGYDDLLDALDAAVRARLLDEPPGVPGRYVFHHGIVHDLVYTGVPAARRALLHHRVAEERKPRWLIPVSIICGRRAAGR